VNLAGAVVVVTGASAGIGEATALRFARAGSRLVLAARRADRLEALAERIRAHDRDVLTVRCDVTRRDDLDALAAATLERFGRADVVVANAGIPGGGPFRELSADRIDLVVETNVLGVMHTVRAFLPTLVEQHAGHVVVVSSLAGRFATPGSSIYGATKHAVTAFAESLAYELEPFGVRVTSVNPGFTETEAFRQSDVPKPFVMDAGRVARTIVDVVEHERGPEVSVPRWPAAFQLFRVLTPRLYRWGLRTIGQRAARRADV
jgi:NADP-dependent 3-hydroxy acid dehydrogenase YdfG